MNIRWRSITGNQHLARTMLNAMDLTEALLSDTPFKN